MENLRIKYLATAVVFFTSGAINAQQVISLGNDLDKAQEQTEKVKREMLNSADVFISKGPGSLRNIIEKSKGQGCLYMTNVTIKGEINFSDLHFMAALPAIEKLDLCATSIVGDGNRSNNVYPSHVYQGLKACIKEIILPGNLLAIDRMAFKDLGSLQKVVIPGTCRVIGEKAFSNTTSLAAILLPDSLMIIEDGAFSGSGIEILSLPKNIKSLGRGSFQSSMLKHFSSEKVGECFFINDRLLADCPHLEYVAFHKKVRVIGKQILSNTPNLKVVKFGSPLPPYLLDKSLKHLSSDAVLQVPESSLRFYKKKSGWRRFKKRYVTVNELNHSDTDTRHKENLSTLAGQSFVTQVEVAEPSAATEVQEVDVIKELGFDQSKPDVPESNSSTNWNESLSVMVESVEPKALPKAKPEVTNQKQKIEAVDKSTLEPLAKSESAIPESAQTDSLPSKESTFGILHEKKIEEIEIDEILAPTPAKVYWLSGKLYVESSRIIKVANLMTLDGMYIYGKAESGGLWSFKIDAARVASVRVSYVDSDIPEIIKIH